MRPFATRMAKSGALFVAIDENDSIVFVKDPSPMMPRIKISLITQILIVIVCVVAVGFSAITRFHQSQENSGRWFILGRSLLTSWLIATFYITLITTSFLQRPPRFSTGCYFTSKIVGSVGGSGVAILVLESWKSWVIGGFIGSALSVMIALGCYRMADSSALSPPTLRIVIPIQFVASIVVVWCFSDMLISQPLFVCAILYYLLSAIGWFVRPSRLQKRNTKRE